MHRLVFARIRERVRAIPQASAVVLPWLGSTAMPEGLATAELAAAPFTDPHRTAAGIAVEVFAKDAWGVTSLLNELDATRCCG